MSRLHGSGIVIKKAGVGMELSHSSETGTRLTSEGTWERLGGTRESSGSQGVETSTEEVIKANQAR